MLIVDDNEDMLNFLSSHFQTSYTIVTAVDGVDALNKLKEQEVALIISDWMMPNMNGIDLCKAVRNNQLTSHIPFILLTAKTDTEAKITSMNCGADAYIEKPFSLQYLEACIKTCWNCVCSYDKSSHKCLPFPSIPLRPTRTIRYFGEDESPD